MGHGASAFARASSKSNAELLAGLHANMQVHKQDADASDGGSPPVTSWTTRQADDLFVPSLDEPAAGLAEERAAYDITVKLFHLPGVPPAARCAHTRDALALVLRELAVPSVDLLIASLPNIAFDADDESSSGDDDYDDTASGSLGSFSTGGSSDQPAEDLESIMRTWRTLEDAHAAGLVARLGLAEFGTARLARVLARAAVRPSVDQINVRDCCVVPRPLILFARREGVELLTHNDCTDILPPRTLEALLADEVAGGVEALAALEKGREADAAAGGRSVELVPLWVVKYTAVVKNRGVVENKGYFAAAELRDR
jgi:glutamate--cysteine ligase regulatory subunit